MSFRSKIDRLRTAGGGLSSHGAPVGADAFDGQGSTDGLESSAGPALPASGAKGATLDDLRARIEAILERKAVRAPPPQVDTVDLPFVCEPTPSGPLYVSTRHLSPAHRTGRASLLSARSPRMDLLALLALDPSLAGCDPTRALYLDTETTGLHGGTGTVAFLVGMAFWDPDGGGLIVEQLLVRQLGEEAPMLERVAERVRAASMLVTFNGKSFDLPLLRTRFVMAQRPLAPGDEPPHLDLLHVARRIHKRRGVTCKLTTIEERILGFARHDDVPSGEVSACYLHFLRTGQTQPLLGVVEHNAWDVVAMAALVGLYGEPLEGTALCADDLAAMAQSLLRAGAKDLASDAAACAMRAGGGAMTLRARAEIAKARGDRQRALDDFEELSAHVDDPTVRLELAKLYEHYVKAPERALGVVRRGTGEKEEHARRRAARLERKISRDRQGRLFVKDTRKTRPA